MFADLRLGTGADAPPCFWGLLRAFGARFVRVHSQGRATLDRMVTSEGMRQRRILGYTLARP